jgi:hypothetical protein
VAGPDLARLVLVSSAGSVGSGYLVSERLVLTAWHVVRNAVNTNSAIALACYTGGGWVDVSCTWHVEGTDACLLTVNDPAWIPPEPTRALWWGRVVGDELVRCSAIGFPRVQTRGRDRRLWTVVGTVTPGAAQRDALLAVTATNGAPRDDTGLPSGWSGLSGAALFCGPWLTGMLVGDPARWQSDRIDGIRIEHLVSLDGFTQALTSAGSPFSLRPVRSGSDGWPVPESATELEDGIRYELQGLDLQTLRGVADDLGIGDVVAEPRTGAAVLASEFAVCSLEALAAVAARLQRVKPDVAFHLYQRLAPYRWLGPSTLRELAAFLHAGLPGRVVGVNSWRTDMGATCVRCASGAYGGLPSGWGLAEVRWEGELDEEACLAVVAAKLADALKLDDEWQLDYTSEEVEEMVRQHTIMLLIGSPRPDARLLNSLRRRFPEVVFMVHDDALSETTFAPIAPAPSSLIRPPLDRLKVREYYTRLSQLRPVTGV